MKADRGEKVQGQGAQPGTLEWELDNLVPLLRTLVEHHLERVMEKERDTVLGYGLYERKPVGVTNERNGSTSRRVMTRLGELELEVPRDRAGEFKTAVLGRYQRREGKVNRLILEMFIGGISTRRMKKLTQMLLGRGYSASTISEINKSLTGEMKEWLYGPVPEEIAVLFIDGHNLPVRRFHVSKESLLLALGVTRDGRRRILGVSLGDRESAANWKQFLGDLKKRGLKGVRLAAMDGLPGLESAFEEVFPRAQVQRCTLHKTWNVATKLPRSIQAACLAQMKRIFHAADEAEARRRAAIWRQEWQKAAPSAVECLFKDLDACLTFYRFPKSIRRSLRTTNIIERLFKEFRRRTRAMDSFPNEECCLRCIYALSRNLDATWSRIRLWRGDPFGDVPTENEPVAEASEPVGEEIRAQNQILERAVEAEALRQNETGVQGAEVREMATVA